MRRHIVTLFQLLLLITPFAFTSVNDELFEFNKMIVVYVFTVLIGAAWIWRMLQEHRVIFTKTSLLLPTLFWVASQTLSTLFSLHPNTSLFGYYSRFHGGLLSTLSYTLLFFAAVSNLDKRDLRRLIPVSLWAAIGVALYAIPEHFGVSPSCVLITGEFTVSCWVQDVQTRVFATFGQPNWLAAYFLMLMPLAIWLSVQNARQKTTSLLQTWWPTVALVLFTLALLYTRSRSGFLALIAELAILIGGVGVWWFFRKDPPKTLFKPLVLALLPLGFALILGSPFSPSLFDVIKNALPSSQPVEVVQETAPENPSAPAPATTALESFGTDSSKIREVVWKGALEVWKRYPLLGSGVETFAYSYYKDRPREHNDNSEWDFLYNRAHNEYLNALATTGIVGFLALVLLNIATLGMFAVQARAAIVSKDASRFWLAVALAAGYVSAMITNFFGFSTVMIGVLSFLLPAWSILFETEPQESAEKKSIPLKASRVKKSGDSLEFNLESDSLFYGVTILGSLFLLMSIFTMWNNDRLMALAKRQFGEGQALKSYEIYEQLTRRAPHEAVFWNEKSIVLAQLSAATLKEDPAIAAQLAKQALEASDRTVALNPAQLNFWKSRARVFLILSLNDESKLSSALEALKTAQDKAPTDAKVQYNQALVYDSMGKGPEADIAYQTALDLRPNYEEARQAYGRFLERSNQLEKAVEQYEYVLKNLNPGDTKTREHLEELSATVSAKRV